MLAAGTYAQATYSATWYGVAVMAPTLRSRLDLSLSQVGVLISASVGGSLFGLIPWGHATDRLGERIVLVVGLGVGGSALLAAAWVHSFWWLFALLALAGFTGSGVQPASGRSIIQWFAPEQRGLALGIRQTAVPLSGFAVAVALPPVIRSEGVSWGFGALGAATLTGGIAGAVVLRRPRQSQFHDPGAEARHPFREARIWIVSIASALFLAPQLCIAGFTVIFLHERRGLSDAVAAAALAVMQLLAAAGRVGAGQWSDHAGNPLRPLRIIALASAASVGLLAMMSDAPLVALLPILVMAGAVSMSWNSLSVAATLDFAGAARGGAAIGFQQTVLNLPGAAYPAAFAALVGATSWPISFATLALFPLLGRRLLLRVTAVRGDLATDDHAMVGT